MPSHAAAPACRLAVLVISLIGLLLLTRFQTTSAAYDSTVLKGCPNPSFAPNIVASKEQAQLKVLVPNITSLRQFVNCSDPTRVTGFCIDVFEAALSIVSPSSALSSNMSIHYTCFNFSSSPSSPNVTYNSMIELVANQDFDVVVGDVSIGAQRLSMVDFTHKYMESGVVILAKVVQKEVSSWLLFASPFSGYLWASIVVAFVLTGGLICYLERGRHPEFTQGHIRHRLNNLVWFSVEALVLLDRDHLKNGVARGVMLSWLFFVVLMDASYTAGLSSFLTVSNLSPNTPDLLSLRDSGLKIGYRRGSIVKDFLTQRLQIPLEQLVDIRMTADFVSNLTKGPDHGGVAAIVDERPYAAFILSSLSSSSCDFGITGPPLTQEGFGFGFNKEHDLGATFSIALMNLTESGCLQDLQDKYGIGIDSNKCSESGELSTKVTWESSIAIFIPLVGALCLCIIAHYLKRYLDPLRHRRRNSCRISDDVQLCAYPTRTHRTQQVDLQNFF